MAFHLLLIFSLLNLAFARSHATLTKEELYWISAFPNTPMPKFLHDILPQPGRSTMFNADPMFLARDVAPTNKGVDNHPTIDPEIAYDYFYDSSYKASRKQSAANNVTPTNKGVDGHPNIDPEIAYDYFYDSSYKASKKQSTQNNADSTNKGVDDSIFGNKKSLGRKAYFDDFSMSETTFFLETTLQFGAKVNLPRLTQKANGAVFLPQQIAKSMPMSIDKFPEILKNFSLKFGSKAANFVHITIFNCERAEMRGEEKHCTTSLEAFVDLGISMLGKNAKLLSHELGKETNNPLFTIGEGVQSLGQKNLVCHKMKYPYAIYLCHSIKKTEVYKVPLVSQDGTKANALAVCHKDTSAWSPFHMSFQILKVKPGTVPICHFLRRDTTVWIAK